MSPTDSARDDLAYMRALVEAPGNFQRSFGEAYFTAGLCYGLQMLGHAAQALGWLPGSGLLALTIGIAPTLVFLVLLAWIIHRERRGGLPAGGAVGRAIAAVGSSAGLANLFLIAVVGIVAWSQKSLTIWLIYPCAVLVLQGSVWLVFYMLRRRFWLAVVAFGWFVTALLMAVGVALQNTALFIGMGGFGFLAFMLVPGWILMRQPDAG